MEQAIRGLLPLCQSEVDILLQQANRGDLTELLQQANGRHFSVAHPAGAAMSRSISTTQEQEGHPWASRDGRDAACSMLSLILPQPPPSSPQESSTVDCGPDRRTLDQEFIHRHLHSRKESSTEDRFSSVQITASS